jgi:hypothetical protein
MVAAAALFAGVWRKYRDMERCFLCEQKRREEMDGVYVPDPTKQ